MARKKSLQKLLDEYECDGQMSFFDFEDSAPEESKSLCSGLNDIPFTSEPMPVVKGKARRRASANENPHRYHIEAYNSSMIHCYFRCIYSLVDHVKKLRQKPSQWHVRSVQHPDYVTLDVFVSSYCTFDTDLIEEVLSLG